MKKQLKILVCPECKNNLIKLHSKKLLCSSCKNYYPIKDGIPVLLPSKLDKFKVLEAEYHDHEAHQYSEINMTDSYRVTFYHEKYLKLFQEFKQNATVLEVGSGDGQDASHIKALDLTLIQSDISFEMVKLAKNKSVSNSIYVVSDAETIPCKDSSLEAIMIVGALHHLPSPINFFKEARRTLKSGGILIIGFEPNCWPYFSVYPILRFLKNFLKIDKYTQSKHSDVSIGDSETEGFTQKDFKKFLKESDLNLQRLDRIWLINGFIHTILSIINSKLPPEKLIDLPVSVQKIIIFIDDLILSLPILRNFCWHWTLVAKKNNV